MAADPLVDHPERMLLTSELMTITPPGGTRSPTTAAFSFSYAAVRRHMVSEGRPLRCLYSKNTAKLYQSAIFKQEFLLNKKGRGDFQS
jgi:hypothetical protein